MNHTKSVFCLKLLVFFECFGFLLSQSVYQNISKKTLMLFWMLLLFVYFSMFEFQKKNSSHKTRLLISEFIPSTAFIPMAMFLIGWEYEPALPFLMNWYLSFAVLNMAIYSLFREKNTEKSHRLSKES